MKSDFSSLQLLIEWRDTQSLRPDPKNSKIHPARQIKQVCASIVEFGWTNPILIDENDCVLAGHSRLLAAKELGLAQGPTIRLSHMSPAQKRAYPKEHQFQKGHKPLPRRRKKAAAEADITDVFWRVLQEKRRVTINGKGTWVTASELLVRRAYNEAEKGSPTVQRLLNQLLLENTNSDDEMPKIEILP